LKKVTLILDLIIKIIIPFLALLSSYFIFKISDWITPINNIENVSIKWAFDLTFNTSILTFLYELIKNSVMPKTSYNINIHDSKGQNSIALDNREAENVLPLKCTINIVKKKAKERMPSTIVVNYPKWITLDIDNADSIDVESIRNNKDKCVIFIDPNYIFNSNIVGDESYVLNLKIAPRVISPKKGYIQAIVKTTFCRSLTATSTSKDFKIKIL